MKMHQEVVITGIGIEIPGAPTDTIAELLPEHLQPKAFDATIRVGRKGIRYKDHATLLAMSAGVDALRNAGLPETAEAQVDPPSFGVVVSSNLGNLNTVASVVRTIRDEHVDATSAMDLPNASSNVVASSLAIRHGLQGPNLMLCNGATSSIDALHLAANCIRAGRAQRMLVVGVEVDNEVVRALPSAAPRWFNGAVAVLVESGESARARGAKVRGRIGQYRFVSERCDRSAQAVDASRYVGEGYGAEGMIQLAVAMQAPGSEERSVILECGNRFGDAVASTLEVELCP